MTSNFPDEYITAEMAKIFYGRGYRELMALADHGLVSRIERDPDENGRVTYVFRRSDVIALDAESRHV